MRAVNPERPGTRVPSTIDYQTMILQVPIMKPCIELIIYRQPTKNCGLVVNGRDQEG